jgi:hypothetical protein
MRVTKFRYTVRYSCEQEIQGKASGAKGRKEGRKESGGKQKKKVLGERKREEVVVATLRLR